MKLKMTALLKGLDGKVLIGPDLAEMTLRGACTNALMAVYQDESPTGEEKYKRYELARIVNSDDEPDLKSEQIADIKRLIGKAFGPAVVGPVYELLDPTPSKAKN